jgi:hypothetical protein
MSSMEYQPSTVALASILVARNKATSASLDELKTILGSSWPQLDTVSIGPNPKAPFFVMAAIRHGARSFRFLQNPFRKSNLLVGKHTDMLTKCRLCFLWQGHVYSCYSAMIQEDKSSMHSTEVASSGVSVAAHVGSPDTSVNANNTAAGTASPATPDNKRRTLRSPQRQ